MTIDSVLRPDGKYVTIIIIIIEIDWLNQIRDYENTSTGTCTGREK